MGKVNSNSEVPEFIGYKILPIKDSISYYKMYAPYTLLIKKELNDKISNEVNITNWKNKFMKIINFIKKRLTRWQDKERYQEFTNDLLHHGAIDYDTYEDIINSKNVKGKDNFER